MLSRLARLYARTIESALARAVRRSALRAEYQAYIRFVRHES